MGGIAERLKSVEVLDDEGRPVTVGSAWSVEPALLVFIRHFG